MDAWFESTGEVGYFTGGDLLEQNLKGSSSIDSLIKSVESCIFDASTHWQVAVKLSWLGSLPFSGDAFTEPTARCLGIESTCRSRDSPRIQALGARHLFDF